ncbi:MAG: Na+/H+ antiporter NhaC family protein [Clostridia bacterium]|nr:Na+/H+ antiporter NhaC family protein [Clostridia bacterium]
MSKKRIIQLSALAIVLLAVILLAVFLPKDTVVECGSCGGSGVCADCNGLGIIVGANEECGSCEAAGVCADCAGTGSVVADSMYYATFMALVPPIVAIGLALITKEVYSSLFIGIVLGGIFAADFSFAGTVDAVVSEGIISAVSGTAGIFVFLVILGIIVAILNRAGGAQAFGKWAEKHVKSRAGALLATFALGVLIFIDDYFNCLTVGAVMRPLTDKHKISRAKLAYVIDATAAPICMIAPVSSWAAAVSGSVESETMSGIELFVRAIPFNFYSLLTIVFVITLAVLGYDYGKMAGFEVKAQGGDLLGDGKELAAEEEPATSRATVWDLIVPIIALIVASVFGLLYVGGLFAGADFVTAFGDTDATVGLPWGSIIALVFVIVYFLARRLITAGEMMKCIPQGFIAMVPAILILTFATGLKNVTGLLGADVYVEGVMAGAAEGLKGFLPAIIFLVACFLSFSTGTSWGTFGILIPIVTAIFAETDPIFFVGVSACLAGAVCGDHCSPISDTTIMASAGAQCNHVNHVATQLPYAITVAAVSFVMFLFAGFVPIAWLTLPVGVALTVATVFGIRYFEKKRAAKAPSAE